MRPVGHQHGKLGTHPHHGVATVLTTTMTRTRVAVEMTITMILADRISQQNDNKNHRPSDGEC